MFCPARKEEIDFPPFGQRHVAVGQDVINNVMLDAADRKAADDERINSERRSTGRGKSSRVHLKWSGINDEVSVGTTGSRRSTASVYRKQRGVDRSN